LKTVYVENSYPYAAERVWALATDFASFTEVMDGIVTFEGLPEGRTTTGQKIAVKVSVFGKLPKQDYQMDVIECDDQAMLLRSSERGAGIRSWKHTLRVIPTDDGCTLTDTIEIDAGWKTAVFVLWARYVYNARHKPRLRILARGDF
jgi:ligand-binding SRPBCC domain-containing protein